VRVIRLFVRISCSRPRPFPAVCARYGLRIGAVAAPFVLGLMYLEFPIAYPIAKLLDRLLGEEQGVTYKKAELKTFVGLHKRASRLDFKRVAERD